MIETVRNAWKIEDLRKKMGFTLFILVLFRIGTTIPVPFIDTRALSASLEARAGTIFGYMDLLSGGAFSQGTVFALSISPYINASIILQLLTIAIPALERLSKEGDTGRKKIGQYTRYLTVFISSMMAYGAYGLLNNQFGVINSPGALTALVIVVTLTAGSLLLVWLGDQINSFGIGNGISIILFAGIAARAPASIRNMVAYVLTGLLHPAIAGVIVIGAIAMVALVVMVTNAERRIPVQYAKRVVGRKIYGGQSTHIPVKVNSTGVIPVIFAQSFLSIPSTITMFVQPAPGGFWDSFTRVFSMNHPVYAVLYAVFIVGFSFFYMSTQMNPQEIGNNLSQNGGTIRGIRQGRSTTEYLRGIFNRITFFGSWFLVFIAIVPIITSWFMPPYVNISLGGTTVIILVGVALETVKQMESMMLVRHYRGFLE